MNDAEISLWAEDECHFNLHGSSTRIWAPKGERPIQLFAPGRKKVGYFGATNLTTGQLEYQRAECFNAATFKDFLSGLLEIHNQIRKKICLIVDNARWHHAKIIGEFLEKNKDKLILLFLPPYSPEQNPQERVWKQTRRKATHNKYFETELSLIIAVENQFYQWRKPNNELWNLCAFK